MNNDYYTQWLDEHGYDGQDSDIKTIEIDENQVNQEIDEEDLYFY